MKKRGIAIIFLLLFAKFLPGQVCTNTGQTPSSAVLICSLAPVVQPTISLCGQTNIPSCIDAFTYQNKNPYWYKLACYSPGTLGFVITPDNSNDNYDWQLFDITTRNPDDVFTDGSLFVASNWSTLPGETGASIDGISLRVCYGPLEAFSLMPDLVTGHEYLLMVSNHDGTPGGFQLAVTGGTAIITDPVEPKLQSARLSCDGTQVILKLNRGMKCNSIAADGSDFTISGGYIVTSATSAGCGSNNNTDSVAISLNSPLPPGNYTLTIQNGMDGNTLIDNCDRLIPFGDQVSFTVAPLQPTPMDSIKTVGCSPATLQLVFSRPIRCNSIASNGSDFTVTGPQTVSIIGATSSCNAAINPITSASVIDLKLASPIVVGGIYQITLTNGSDGNTIIDECGRVTPAGSSVFLTVKNAVSAAFTYSIKTNCKKDTLTFIHDGLNDVNSWNWSFDNTTSSNLQNPVQIYPASGQHTARLIVSNGTCKDTTTQNIVLDNKVIAAFEAPDIICPEDAANFINTTIGKVDNWEWSFGNGNASNLQTPISQNYPITGREIFYNIKLVASSTTMNCKDSVTHRIRVLSSCLIAVPSAFTPNGDGINDYLYPLNALKADKLEFKVFNRLGQLLFETKDWTKKWDGKIKGIVQTTGVYAWILSFIHHDTGEKVFMKGTSLLIR